MQTISILLDNRYRDAERVIGLFSRTGYKIEQMSFRSEANELSRLVIVASTTDKNIEVLLRRLRQQIRVTSIEHVEGDELSA
jgi:acetolactate synthase small subunit